MTPRLPSLPPSMLGAHLCAGLLALGCLASALHWAPRLRALARPPQPLLAHTRSVDAWAGDALRLYGAAPPRPAAAPEGFRLWGVIGGGEHAGAALIGVGDAHAQVVPVGAEVAPGVRLIDTGFGRAVLLRDGMRETLATRPDSARPAASTRDLGMPSAMPPATAPGLPAGGAAGLPDRFELEQGDTMPGGESAAAEAAHLRQQASRQH